ncbi:hypothetical protein OTK49_01245 [Vibrio coralliirubri]|uniref:hypothetical protein n=1 Tax=Vibrio coralliirubri TaxID=1516159 RepID=UPI00228355DB|nr:hypothetical protein [Vibrio coralliirubri]MCY9861155.1 hypothetical protein [Vibrio coralliirubri]
MSKFPQRLKMINTAIVFLTLGFTTMIEIKLGFLHEDYLVYIMFIFAFIINPVAICSLSQNLDGVNEHDKSSIIRMYMLAVTALSVLSLALVVIPFVMNNQEGGVVNLLPSLICIFGAYALMITSYYTLKKIVISEEDDDDE